MDYRQPSPYRVTPAFAAPGLFRALEKALGEVWRTRLLAVVSLTLLVIFLLSSAATAQTNEWTWMGGSDGNSGPRVYGTLGTPAAGNIPGGRLWPATWTDHKGNLWLFGGQVGVFRDDVPPLYISFFSDLWEFNSATSEWAWMGGSNSTNQRGVYGALGTPAAGNTPSAREGAATWIDGNGNFWLFGGFGYDSAGTIVYLNDLWEFNPSNGQWTWMGGSSTVSGTCFTDGSDASYCGGAQGVYAMLGTSAAANIPAGRYKATTWVDSSGNFWLFGGYQIDTTVQFEGDFIQYYFNDLWEFNPSTNQWTWMGGSSTPQGGYCNPDTYQFVCGQAGIYGTLGSPSEENIPGSREAAMSFTDKGGNLWLVGGTAFDANGNNNPLNDVWKFTPATNEWTWMGGSSTAPACWIALDCGMGSLPPGIYGSNGTLGTPAAGNIPGFLSGAAAWTDKGGNFWVFSGLNNDNGWEWDDLWEFNSSANEWAWMNGSLPGPFGVNGVYGTLGTPAPGNVPGSRYGGASWVDNNGHFWLYGGYGYPADFLGSEYLDDLWEYQPSAPTPVPSFAVVAVPAVGLPNASLSVPAGTSGVITINTVVADDFAGAIALEAFDLPNGITANFSPDTITGNGSSQMTLSADLSTPTGTYLISVTGTSGGIAETATVSLVVTTAPPPNFALAASAVSLTVAPGSPETVALTVTPQYGFNASVTFACSAGITCTFSPATVTPSGAPVTTQLTFSASTQSSSSQPGSGPFLPLTTFAATLCLFGCTKRHGPRWMVLVIIFTGLGLVFGCGGSGNSGGGGTGPTYVPFEVTVSAMGGNILRTTTFSITEK